MDNLKTYNEFNTLNENITSNLFKKIKDIVIKKFNKLSSVEQHKIKMALEPYEDMTFDEIKNDIAKKLSLVKENINDIDPYGEENWDDDARINGKRKIRHVLYLIFSSSLIISLIFNIIMSIWFPQKDFSNIILNHSWFVMMISAIITAILMFEKSKYGEL